MTDRLLHPQLAARVFGAPLLIHPVKGRVIAQALAQRMDTPAQTLIVGADGKPMAWYGDDEDSGFDREAKPDDGYDLVRGIAVINITGTLVHRTNRIRPYSGMLGYNAIRSAFLSAMDDAQARAVVLLCNSPGGEVSGCFDLVDTIHAARDRKPIWAICDDMAYSACYALASAAHQVITPRTGGVGSVGVITMHADLSAALSKEGIKVTIFQHGARKAAGNPYQPLSDIDSAETQAEIDRLGDLFDETVARNRGLSVASVREMQARCYMGASGVDVGLADGVAPPDEAFQLLADGLG